MSNKPNIVFIFQDHQAYYGHGQLGNGPKIHRPNYERIVNEGVEFTHSYTACPLCGPARRTILTGLYPHNHEEIKNESNSKYKDEMYLTKLAEAGYKNYYFGKWHAGRGTALDFDCEGFSCKGYGNPYITSEYEEYLERNNLPFIEVKIEKDFEDSISRAVGIKEGELYKPKFLAYSEYAAGLMKTPTETHEAYFLANLACEKLEELAEDSSKHPFHLRVDFWGPHEPYFPSKEFLDLYDPKKIPETPSFRDNLEDKPEFYQKDMSGILADEDNNLKYPNPLPWSEWQKVLAYNYAEQSLVDSAGGLILNKLDELGLSENTVVIWATDHGDALGCHGGHFDKDSYMPQEMVRVPLAIRYPSTIPAGKKCSKLISNIDYAPTILDIAGLNFDNPIDGQSFLKLCTQENSEWRDDLMVETHGHFTTIVSRLIIHDNHKYIFNEGYIDELYDLTKDPFELKNLINNKEYNGILADLKQRLKRWREKTGDNITFNKIKGKKLNR